ncbi:N-acetylmuramidase family protein [Aquiflexum sp. TKW24L]|uniref:N-acetylmuramidase family protein n=1 Tax=Aquiflexum sp. TKW24L TaxID=2942212 RepID=UPI0020C0DC92|nr:N-acetylmuramidase family protein [Aquiflexum sp. TKW24L]MCL6258121.1 N-acetylmuramidase family protein [Aquiflexum sp. TKW24L]
MKKQSAFYQLIIKIAATILMAVAIGFLIRNFYTEEKDVMLAMTIPSIIAVGLIYGILIRYFKTEEQINSYYVNKYHDIFFKGTIVFAITLVLITIFYSILMYIEKKNLFSIVGLLIIVIWIAVFMIYFVWSVYHFNINFGITDGEWGKIAEAKREAREFGMDLPASGVREPLYNPYRSQTFGLPPGTVRGMIAFTLLFGGISLLISSMGSEELSSDLVALRIQQFEFFETAFLMMIAFYFGDKSLKYFRERWKNPNQQADGSIPPTPPTAPPNSQLPEGVMPSAGTPPPSLEQDDSLGDDDREFMEGEETVGDVQPPPATGSPVTNLKHALLESREEQLPVASNFAFVQIIDNINSKILNDEEIKEVLENLAEKENIILSLPVLKSVISVESSGRGHLSDGRAKILFEGHLMWRLLSSERKMPEEEILKLQKSNEDILYKSWTRKYYKGGIAEYDRLDRARKIDPEIAVFSASWGLFQILGENLNHNIKGRKYADYKEFEEKQNEHEKFHLMDFLEFIKIKKLKGVPLINFISEEKSGNYDWASFAHGYNGSGYKVNKYDTKLQAAYEKFKKMHS